MDRPMRRFSFRLCLALGVIHPDHLLESLTADQLADWEAYGRVEPFGGYIDDIRWAVLTQQINNRWRGKGESAKDVSYFRSCKEAPREQTVAEQVHALKSASNANSRSTKRRDSD